MPGEERVSSPGLFHLELLPALSMLEYTQSRWCCNEGRVISTIYHANGKRGRRAYVFFPAVNGETLVSTVMITRTATTTAAATVWTRFLFACICVNWLISIGHLLSTKDRRICLFFACHLSSLTSTRLSLSHSHIARVYSAYRCTRASIDWKSTLNRYLLEENERTRPLFFFHLPANAEKISPCLMSVHVETMVNLILIVCKRQAWRIYVAEKREAWVDAFF